LPSIRLGVEKEEIEGKKSMERRKRRNARLQQKKKDDKVEGRRRLPESLIGERVRGRDTGLHCRGPTRERSCPSKRSRSHARRSEKARRGDDSGL